MEYTFQSIEQKWKQYWKDNNTYTVSNNSDKPKFYILDMFPYPSGAGLHVGHPLGYIASDIYARYKKLKGFNVLHPMGFDAFGLPAEQYALETGQHPTDTTEKNIARYKQQLDNIGFCYDWSRAVRTSDKSYYKWTQWIFLQLFHSWYDRATQKAKHINELINIFAQEGNVNNPCPGDDHLRFDANEWNTKTTQEQRNILMNYRLAFLGYAEVWWCEELGTVLANDEVVNGVSERGGFPVERKKMRQWFLRITEYADRLLTSLNTLDWTDAMKEMQRNWIGKSEGAEINFQLSNSPAEGAAGVRVFTTRPDTIFGVDFMVLAPEHELVDTITTAAQQAEVSKYKTYVKTRSERERMSEVKQISGAFTGAYVVHPFTGKEIPIWISEYVLAGYGTGAIMAVPSGDSRDHAFAQHFSIPITNIFGDNYTGKEAYTSKEGTIENSGFLSGLNSKKAATIAIQALNDADAGVAKINFKMRDAGFSRQRYWGEPFPIVYIDDVAYAVDEPQITPEQDAKKILPVELPLVKNYKPGPEGQGPLANVTDWVNVQLANGIPATRETSTMPGFAGSSWYFLRYMDPQNDNEFAAQKATDYWREVDIYIGGTEHAVGHLLYSRMWTKVLHDLGHISFEEPFKKLVNQGMIQGSSRFVYRITIRFSITSKDNEGFDFSKTPIIYLSEKHYKAIIQISNDPKEVINYINKIEPNILSQVSISEISIIDINELHVDVNFVDGMELNIEAFKQWKPEFAEAEFLLEEGKYICGAAVEKMSKSKYNVVNPDDIVAQYGADTFRMYEMFLGPIDVSKPWDTKGIEGVHRFLKKMWRLYNDEQKGWIVSDDEATEAELRVLHKTIKKIGNDIEQFSLNTSVSQFMICVNELATLHCHKRVILEPLTIVIAPFAPHFAEELWHQFGNTTSVLDASFPEAEEKHLLENTKLYPVAINGKTRMELEFPLDAAASEIEQSTLSNEAIQKWMEGKPVKKFIFVKGKMINVVV